MKLLLDSHVLLWAAKGDNRLTVPARKLLEDPSNDLFFSAASLWEITIKRSLGSAHFPLDPRALHRALLGNGYRELAVSSEHALAIEALPNIHRDPFDRILRAQATVEGLTLLTADKILSQYPGPVQLV